MPNEPRQKGDSMSDNESEKIHRMDQSGEGGEAQSSVVDSDGVDPVPRDPRPPVNMETPDAPMRSLSDVWPEGKEVQPVRVLRPVQGGVSKPGLSRKVDRRTYKHMGKVK